MLPLSPIQNTPLGDRCWTYEEDVHREQLLRSFQNPLGQPVSGSYPATCVSYDDALAYTRWLSSRTGKPYRLLTEAEWEYSARAGTKTAFNSGANAPDPCQNGSAADCRDRAVGLLPVGSFVANAFGLQDMHGNVAEWVADCWSDSLRSTPVDGSARVSADGCTLRVTRGGSFATLPATQRSASRLRLRREIKMYDLGFRVARLIE